VIEDRDDLIKQKSHVIDQQKRRILQLEDYLRLEKVDAMAPAVKRIQVRVNFSMKPSRSLLKSRRQRRTQSKKAKLDAKGCPTNCHVNRFTSI
jgi:hypothetical protein